jgi:hypothetical protein
MKFDGIWLEFSRIDEIWTRSPWLHLDDRSLMNRSLEFQICEFIDLLQEFDLNFDFGYMELY